MKLGAHISIAGGYHNAIQKIHEIGGNCLQIFSSSPRNWETLSVTDEQITIFQKYRQYYAISPIYFHASYLINLADNDRIGKQSIQRLINELTLADKMNIVGTIIHLGSFKQKGAKPTNKQYTVLLHNIQDVLDHTPENTYFIIENAGNKKLCWSLEELGFILNEIKNSRVRVCLDTCHLWATDFDLSTEEKFQRFFEKFDKKVGLEKLELFHVNDSQDQLGSFRDRHENIGEGTIPKETFRLLLTNLQTKNKPCIIETPGFDKKGPDKKNIALLRHIAFEQSS